MKNINKHIDKSDFLIIGAGIIGLSIARELKKKFPAKTITVIEKEQSIACHSSGRNSGVLHAGFYYTSNSLKAKFTRNGNAELTKYCEDNNLSINKCKKIVVTQNEKELKTLFELEKRGKKNDVDIKIIDEKELLHIDDNAKTFQNALYSPTTSTIDPIEVCNSIKEKLLSNNVKFHFNCSFLKKNDSNSILTSEGTFEAGKVINCAGLYADKIAKDYGFSDDYIIIPFKGIYLKYSGYNQPVKTNIYPVPNINNPFLGVHYTITVDNKIKIGPTAIPAFWRENYNGLTNFKINEFFQIISNELKLFMKNSFGFRDLAFNEMKKYNKIYFRKLAKNMVKNINVNSFNEWTKPGIRAQLLNTKTNELVQDFVVEGDKDSIHILNAVSPAFTSCFPFSRWVVEEYII